MLISDKTKDGLKGLLRETISKVKSVDKYAEKVYELIKMMRLEI